MRKLITTLLTLSIVIIFYCFTRMLTTNPAGNITGSAELEGIIVEDSENLTHIPNKEEITTTIEPEQDETFFFGEIAFNKSAMLHSLKEHENNLTIYGDIKPEDTRIVELQDTLQDYNKNISLIAWRTDSSKALSYNTSQTYFSACTIKIAYVLSCCKLIDEGLADENTMLTYQEKHYHKGSGNIRKSAYGTQYSIRTLIELCLSISDNVAYKMLLDYFGLEEYNAMVTQLDCESIKIERLWASKVKVKDFIVIWNEVYAYFASGSKMSGVLKKACTNTPFNYGTENLVDVDYSHKSGDNFGEFAAYNDAGIVWEEEAYIYAVFTNSEGTAEDIHTVNTVMDWVYEIIH